LTNWLIGFTAALVVLTLVLVGLTVALVYPTVHTGQTSLPNRPHSARSVVREPQSRATPEIAPRSKVSTRSGAG
jgi:hypothetical protein